MATRRNPEEQPVKRRRRATTPEARENQLIASAVDLAEQQILKGTASSQVVVHYLKLGTSRERLEQEKLRYENELLKVKREAMESQQRVEVMYKEALDAMRSYSGLDPLPEEEDYED